MNADDMKHLDYIQSIISRMSDNSFKIKGLTITLLSAFIGIYVKTNDSKILLVSLVPLLLFWILDSYYLQQERKFRAIYDAVIGKNSNLRVTTFYMPVNKVKGCRYKLLVVMFSKTEWLLYLILIIAVLFYYGIIHYESF